jgi:soluble lytic murein transglycosylase-like protein
MICQESTLRKLILVSALAWPLRAQPSSEQLIKIMEEAVSRQRQAAAAMQDSVARQVESTRLQEQSAGRAAAPAASYNAVEAAPPPAFPEVGACDPIPAEEAAELIDAAANKEGLDRDLLHALIEQESAFLPCAVSRKGALGLMQLMPATAALFGVEDPLDPKENLDAGARFLGLLLERFDRDLPLALGAYNAGPARVEQAGGIPDIPETRNYVHQILERLSRRRAISSDEPSTSLTAPR